MLRSSCAGWWPMSHPNFPNFAPGNVAAVRHGAWSPRRVEPLAAELVATVRLRVGGLVATMRRSGHLGVGSVRSTGHVDQRVAGR